jgi:hypothetical protein
MAKKKSKKKGGGGGGQTKKTFSVGGGQDVSLTSGSMSGIEDFLSSTNKNKDLTDAVGRMFCEHNRDYCHICCVDHRMGNRVMEEAAGLKKKESELEKAARMYATALGALKGMERMQPRPSEEDFERNRQWRDEYKEKLDRFTSPGQEDVVRSVMRRAIDKNHSDELEIQAMTETMARLNPGQTKFEIGGDESQQKIYDEFIKAPQGNENRADYYTCSYCGKTGTVKLLQCSRCKKASYCGHDCQAAAWPAHKKNECVKVPKDQQQKELKKLRLTWDQVEAHGGNPSPGKLEIKAIKDETMFRQVFQCKDRVGMCRRIAAYTNSRGIPGLRVGATITWKNPRFHYFVDGSSGARIEEDDLQHITVA